MDRRIVVSRALLAGALLGLTGCAGMGSLREVLEGMGGMGLGSEVRGEVRWLDERRQELQVESSGGRAVTVSYDSRTEVLYRGERYSVRSLERGDWISARVQRDSRGELHTNRIQVEESVRDRDRDRSGGGYEAGRMERFEGRVERIDTQRGWFELDTRNGRYTVTLPYNPDSSTLSRFRRLRRGDSVRIEGGVMRRERIELRRFL